jgi:hypothetical protein
MENKKKCNCCGCYTVEGISSICPVCFWQNDVYQEDHPNDNGGPNNVSLFEARENYINFRAAELRFKDLVRTPQPDELA